MVFILVFRGLNPRQKQHCKGAGERKYIHGNQKGQKEGGARIKGTAFLVTPVSNSLPTGLCFFTEKSAINSSVNEYTDEYRLP